MYYYYYSCDGCRCFIYSTFVVTIFSRFKSGQVRLLHKPLAVKMDEREMRLFTMLHSHVHIFLRLFLVISWLFFSCSFVVKTQVIFFVRFFFFYSAYVSSSRCPCTVHLFSNDSSNCHLNFCHSSHMKEEKVEEIEGEEEERKKKKWKVYTTVHCVSLQFFAITFSTRRMRGE